MLAPNGVADDPNEEFNVNPNAPTRRARHLQFTIDQFWRKEYLLGLREVHMHHKTDYHECPCRRYCDNSQRQSATIKECGSLA